MTREVTVAAGTNDADWLLSPPDTTLLHEPTVVRLLIQYAVSSNSASAFTAIHGAGIIRMASDPDSFAVPATRPSPISDPESDWLWHTFLPMASEIAGNLIVTPGQAVIDIGAMRKLSNGEGLLLILEADVNFQMRAAIGVRGLFKQ